MAKSLFVRRPASEPWHQKVRDIARNAAQAVVRRLSAFTQSARPVAQNLARCLKLDAVWQLSFRQLLLLAFLLIALLLGGLALRAVYALDQLQVQHNESAARALRLSAAAQTLAEHTIAMERAARQSLILRDAPLLRRYAGEAQAARAALDQLVAGGLPAETAEHWHARVAAIERSLAGPARTALAREREVARQFRELDLIGNLIVQQVQAAIRVQNQALQVELKQSQARLTQRVVLAVALALGLAIALGLGLARPFRQIDRAITGLGENQLDQPIRITGPSDVRKVGQQLDWLRQRLSELDADKARFLRHISHEFKTPLAALREGVSLLADGAAGPLTERQREVIAILRQNTQALQNQIEALLRLNAAAFEARQLKRRPVNLLALVQAQVDAQRLQWQARDLTIRIAGHAAWLPLDEEKMSMALANLLSNAIRFSPPQGRITFTLSSMPPGSGSVTGTVRLDIEDQGPGVAEEDRGRIFEPFYRGERQPQGTARGSGIGLSIVQEYIAAHDGRIELLPADDNGSGAHLRIELPHAVA